MVVHKRMPVLPTSSGNHRSERGLVCGDFPTCYAILPFAHARTLASAQCMLNETMPAQVTTAVSADWYGALATCISGLARACPHHGSARRMLNYLLAQVATAVRGLVRRFRHLPF